MYPAILLHGYIYQNLKEIRQMKKFYEPMLFLSTPDHPNTMGAFIVLKEAVDGEILRDVVEDLRPRFPYFYVRAVVRDNDIFPEPNALPMTARNTWAPIKLNSEESNYHLAAWKYEGNRLAFEITHYLTDGAGFLPYVKSALYLYLSRKTGQTFDPAGFRLPGDVIPESETGNPFGDLNIDAAEEPLYTRKTVKDFYRLNKGLEHDARLFCIKLSETQVMHHCRDFDGSPNTFLAVILARAIRRYDPSSDKTISVSIAIDQKTILGNHDNYRLFASVVELDFPKNQNLDDLMKSCTAARGQVMLQVQPENSLWALKQRKANYAKLDQVPLDVKTEMMAKTAGSPRWSFTISYVNNRTFGPLDPYIEELYFLVHPDVSDVGCEITCINHNFFVAFIQNFSSGAFLNVFLDELKSVGIDYEVMHKEPLRLCGIEAY